MAGEIARCHLPHVADSQGKQQTLQGNFAFFFNGREEVLSGFVAPPVPVFELLEAFAKPCLQRENLSGFLDPAIRIKLFNLFGAEPFDIKRCA